MVGHISLGLLAVVKIFHCCTGRYSHPREPTYWSRQSLSSPSPVETEMDMLVLRERSRRGIHNNGYDVSTE